MASKDLEPREVDIARLMGDVMPEAEDSDVVQRQMVARILEAETLEGIFADFKTTATRDLIGVPIQIASCRLREGEQDGKKGVYMLLDCARLDDGEVFVANTGAPQIMAVVWGSMLHNALPIQVEVAEAQAAKAGRSAPLRLNPIGKTLAAIRGTSK